ncbi:hypothetical protein EDB89DRAFT_1917687 [Lactarius sanguifluus]|nr:hypothetical protein EDB89DRAFT_1917687 [Lactarius sanguifluus]
MAAVVMTWGMPSGLNTNPTHHWRQRWRWAVTQRGPSHHGDGNNDLGHHDAADADKLSDSLTMGVPLTTMETGSINADMDCHSNDTASNCDPHHADARTAATTTTTTIVTTMATTVHGFKTTTTMTITTMTEDHNNNTTSVMAMTTKVEAAAVAVVARAPQHCEPM